MVLSMKLKRTVRNNMLFRVLRIQSKFVVECSSFVQLHRNWWRCHIQGKFRKG